MTMPEGALDFAVSMAREAGALMKQNFSLGMKKEWKEDKTPLTATDIEINAMLLKTCREKYPAYSFIGEEGSELVEGEYAWVCDPIDGTMPFAHGWPTFVFSLALTKNGESILGVIYDPICDRLLHAEKGGGAFLNGKRIKVNSDPDFSKTSFIQIDNDELLSPLRGTLRAKGCYL